MRMGLIDRRHVLVEVMMALDAEEVPHHPMEDRSSETLLKMRLTMMILPHEAPLTTRMELIDLDNNHLVEVIMVLDAEEELHRSVDPMIELRQMDQAVALHSLHVVSGYPPPRTILKRNLKTNFDEIRINDDESRQRVKRVCAWIWGAMHSSGLNGFDVCISSLLSDSALKN